jgi:hypothetical protein
MSTETPERPEANIRAAYAYLSAAVERYRDHSSVTLMNKRHVAELIAERGPQVAEYDRDGKCLFCDQRPPEDGYYSCEYCNAKDYADV